MLACLSSGCYILAFMRWFWPAFVVILVGCATPTTPTRVDAAVVVDGLRLEWTAALGCAPPPPLPLLSGVPPERTLMVDADTLRGFWPTSPLRRPTPLTTSQDFIVGDFVQQAGAWLVCDWREMVRETVACTAEECG